LCGHEITTKFDLEVFLDNFQTSCNGCHVFLMCECLLTCRSSTQGYITLRSACNLRQVCCCPMSVCNTCRGLYYEKILWWLVDEKTGCRGKTEGAREKMLKGEKIVSLTGQSWLKNAPSWGKNSLFAEKRIFFFKER